MFNNKVKADSPSFTEGLFFTININQHKEPVHSIIENKSCRKRVRTIAFLFFWLYNHAY